MKKVTLNILFVLMLLMHPAFVSGQWDQRSPAEQTMEVIQGNSSLPSQEEINSPELYAKPPGGDPIGGISAPIGEASMLSVVVLMGFYAFGRNYKYKNTRQ